MLKIVYYHLVLLIGAISLAQGLGKDNLDNIVKPQGSQPRLENEDAFLTVPQIVRKYGYPMEIHEVTTADGYILTVHRIPHGKNSVPVPNRPVVWLQHGLLADSSNWILHDEDKALAYVLANLGYDVWMGNARGNSYSRRHVHLDPEESDFWRFSFHEMAVYDVPAVLDYILANTGQEQIHYVGHSMGTTMFFVAMAMDPALNDKIRLMTALAPVYYLDYADTPLIYIAPFINQVDWILEFMGVDEFMPSSALMELFGQTICHAFSPINAICSNVLFLVAGYNSDQLNSSAIPIILGHTPSGASTDTLVHFAQVRNSGMVRQFDYGRRENMEIYGTPEPPHYDFNNITVPVAVYWGQNDWLTSPRDVQHLTEQLPNLVRKYRVRHDNYNHLDFIMAKDNHVLLNHEIVAYMQRY